jgi:hypothetical protein
MTTYTNVLTKIAITTLAIVPLLTSNLNSAHAESPGGISEIKNIAEIIANRNPLAPSNAETPADTTEAEVSAERQEAIQWTVKGIEAENAGNQGVALKKYRQAIEADPTFGYPYLFVGYLLGESEIGIECAKFGLSLFVEQNDKDGCAAAIELLKAFHVDI